MVYATHLPHARGDEPANSAQRYDSISICPTHVGMNRAGEYDGIPHYSICPTHVGMNRRCKLFISG